MKSAIAAAARLRAGTLPRLTNKSAFSLCVLAPGISMRRVPTSFSSVPSSGSISCIKRWLEPSKSNAGASVENCLPKTVGVGGWYHQSSQFSSSSGADAVETSPINNSCAAPLKSGRGQANPMIGSSAMRSVIRHGGISSTSPLRRRTGNHDSRIKLKVMDSSSFATSTP